MNQPYHYQCLSIFSQSLHHHHQIQAGCYAGWAGASRPPDSEAKHRGAGRGEEAGADHGEKVARLQGLHQTKGWKEENPTVVFIFRDRTTMSLHLYRKSLLLLLLYEPPERAY